MKLSNVSILYIEDEDVVREIMCSFIGAKYPSVPIYAAGSAEEGLALFSNHRPSLILTDINLTKSNGVQMVRSIRKLDSNTTIIFITGCADIEQRVDEFCGSAACHFVCKPVDHIQLFALLDRYIP